MIELGSKGFRIETETEWSPYYEFLWEFGWYPVVLHSDFRVKHLLEIIVDLPDICDTITGVAYIEDMAADALRNGSPKQRFSHIEFFAYMHVYEKQKGQTDDLAGDELNVSEVGYDIVGRVTEDEQSYAVSYTPVKELLDTPIIMSPELRFTQYRADRIYEERGLPPLEIPFYAFINTLVSEMYFPPINDGNIEGA